MEPDPFSCISLVISVSPISIGNIIEILIIVLLLAASALVSGSEVAFFSLSPKDLAKINDSENGSHKLILKHLERPEYLLANILISNNFINVAIVILTAFLSNSLFDFSEMPAIGFLVQTVFITMILLLCGEIVPKIYATRYSLSFAHFMARPIKFISYLFSPLANVLVSSSTWARKRFESKRKPISMNDLTQAIDLTEGDFEEDTKILKGIARFGNIDVKEVMKPRMDVVAIDIKTDFKSLLDTIILEGYSRVPVYSESFDSIKGILYIKDLIPHFHKNNSFRWQSLIRPPYFVPETKKINDLLEEFQKKKIHMAIVVDEYGGSHGIITLEDILEEIVGDITDEFDEEESFFKEIDKDTFIFEGKTMLVDFYRVLDLSESIFDDIKGDADTLAGLILEKTLEIPAMHQEISIKSFTFTIISVDKRRIKKIKVKRLEK